MGKCIKLELSEDTQARGFIYL